MAERARLFRARRIGFVQSMTSQADSGFDQSSFEYSEGALSGSMTSVSSPLLTTTRRNSPSPRLPGVQEKKPIAVRRSTGERDELLVLDALDADLRAAHRLRRRKRGDGEAHARRFLDRREREVRHLNAQPFARV